MFLKMSQNSQENICVESFDNRPEDVQLCKETPTQVFSSKNCEIFKNTYPEEHMLPPARSF